MCTNSIDLVVHHIINYHLFAEFAIANSEQNLMTLCRSCHTKLHLNNTNIKAHIEETQYSKLLELLETLKSQVPESLMETYKDVEKQLGLTDNQQPSTA
jgi:outer membrane lipopolysaccharide assembly protein LptE/RlpB